jgi:hypothetical protein
VTPVNAACVVYVFFVIAVVSVVEELGLRARDEAHSPYRFTPLTWKMTLNVPDVTDCAPPK